MSKAKSDYRFIDKDPVIDIARTAITQSGKSLNKIADISTVKVGTLRRWFKGGVRRPQHYTITRVLDACGVDNRPRYRGTGKLVVALKIYPDVRDLPRDRRPKKAK